MTLKKKPFENVRNGDNPDNQHYFNFNHISFLCLRNAFKLDLPKFFAQLVNI